jgi:4-hydroxy-tetrahydrodipicolinate synthase
VTANIAPKLCAGVQDMSLAGDYKGALSLHERLVALHDAMFCEANPGPVKYAASLSGLCAGDVRLPLLPPSDAAQVRIRSAMQDCGLL